ncbi:probable G-protein coupled receptor 158 [Pectinophora gossypiella]|uniref:probable G-protein coupled receptor 158 n=1 Tax=Pectinophora gossypiella TaxID=13191 RepID=UPI00214E145F|nr:probable G-protein coupled receptor 158 [Pectinophora gossypiella]
MRARGAAWSAWALLCACAAAAPAAAAPAPAPADPPAHPSAAATAPSTPLTCDPLLLRSPPPKPSNVVEYEAAAIHAARALSELVKRNEANEETAANMARTVARTPLDPPPAAVALGAPRLHIGVLFIVDVHRLVIFQQNNSASLQQFWRTLASAWNASSVVWSNAWFSCEEGFGWWGGAAAAHGAWPVRAAAALFRRIPTVPCEEAMHPWLGGPPRCHPASTDCEAIPTSLTHDRPLEYRCKCRAGYWQAGAGGAGWVGSSALAEGELSCAPCGPVGDAAACLADVYRAALLAANLAGMLLCLVIGLVIFKKRKCKAVAMGMWTVLEVVLVGALLIYASAASQYILSSYWRCIAGAWFRELGFVACYGSVVLRLWVLLAEFRTRKAHRWTPRDSEVLRVVGAMISGAACYLAAFTATTACWEDEGEEDGCARAAWHHVTAAAELLLLLAGLRIAYAARNANVPFQERGWLAAALCCEAFCGMLWRGAAYMGAAPERSPLAAAARAHLSAGAALACVLAPRLWHGYRARSLAQEVSRRGPAEGFSCVEGEEEPTSEEVRAELKRLYVQLEILRNKTLRRDNPHISKRRGGRKPPHRRFSLQKKGSRDKALQARRGGKGKSGGSASAVEASEAGDASRTPEDSVCSNEGPSHYTDGDTQA